MVVATAASEVPQEQFDDYERAFRSLGVRHVHHLAVSGRDEAHDNAKLRILGGATGIFFTGGDQLKITSLIGGTPVHQGIQGVLEGGGLIAGTSAGASAACATMLVTGDSARSPKVAASVRMALGLGFLRDVIFDQHFAERGRIGCLLGAVAQNPKTLGIGVDEDTAIVVEGSESFYVLGGGAVHVLDGSGVSKSNIAEAESEEVLSIFDVTLHVLSRGDFFDLRERHPAKRARRAAERPLGKQEAADQGE